MGATTSGQHYKADRMLSLDHRRYEFSEPFKSDGHVRYNVWTGVTRDAFVNQQITESM